MKIGLVIDMQNGFNQCRQTKLLEKRLVNFISKKPFDYLIATRFINENGSSYEKLLDWRNLKTNEEQSLIAGIQENTDLILDKTTYSCVNKKFLSFLEKINDNLLPEEIYIMGIDTDCCILMTAIDIFNKGIRPIILEEYCTSTGGLKYHTAGLLCLKRLIGSKNIIEDSSFLLK